MFVLAMRGLAAAAAAAIVVGACLWSAISPDDSAMALGKVLENVAQADTVHLKITREGKTGQLWAKQPNRLRYNAPDGTYQIARGSRLWLVDEKANRATSQTSPYFRAGQPGLDLLDLLELPQQEDRNRLLSQRPAERIQRDGTSCDLYRMEVPSPNGKLRIEALVDAGTRMLQSLVTRAERGGSLKPITTIELLAVDKPVDEGLFVVGETLTEDGRVGKVTDVQGIVCVKPVMRKRWTPITTHMLIKPGDWVRTDVRGANAVALRLVKQTDVTLGPGSLVEVAKPNQLRVIHGVLKVVADPQAPVELLGPPASTGQKGQKIQVKGAHIYRLDKEKLVRLDKPPLWLQGFEGATSNESIGSLIAKVEGRDVPLTVGYHKVTVDIRDQIARTVIEESFVNHTSGRLEGVFHFPLPQDASISGFGMWIGDELVMADVVEKQRAREIYEQILRERRDPGLLEWAGGNIFKARIFPIFAHSEKRIKIIYTQVLPLKGNRYRYSYALQSELLKQHPLRELGIDVKISSATPLAKVTSPTHATRIDNTEHSAHVEFAAQEYTPTRDFEVVVEVEGTQSNVVMIPHQRGDDGYFMLQLMPPPGEGDWQREVVPDGQPMELLILADTSGSIDAGGRETQAEFIASLLASLVPEDKVNLACCDVDCQWVFKKPVPADEKNVLAARDFLAGRVSLGWTDLDQAFASALKQCRPNTQVIYVGDGIVTTKDADPVAFGKRLKLLAEGKPAACHAVSISSSFEPVVMKTIAALGGGSVRQIGGEKGPQAVALELLGEISKPTVRDLKIQFKGLQTARVYPETLPNLPAGTQQIILGRYLPDKKDQAGEVIVTGVQGDQPVRFHTRVSLEDAEGDDSFIPRLWARMHLDALLQQGSSQAIQDEVIALSEEYNIMTPYTSFLVLESDEDRERFKVKRRFQMRDAEKFFAEGRDTADYQLMQQQMKRAGDWRLGLRRAVLRQLLALGRDPGMFQRQQAYRGQITRGFNGPVLFDGLARLGGMGMGGGGPMNGPAGMFLGDKEYGGQGASWRYDGDKRLGVHRGELLSMSGEVTDSQGLEDAESLSSLRKLSEELASLDARPMDAKSEDFLFESAGEPMGSLRPATASTRMPFYQSDLQSRSYRGTRKSLSRAAVSFGTSYRRFEYERRQQRQQYTQWLNTLFPHLPPAPVEPPKVQIEKPWPAKAQALAKSLLRTGQLAKLQGGLSIDRRAEGFDARWDRLTSRSQTLELVSPRAWLVRSGGHGSPTTVQWCDDKQRGVFSKAFQLGRLRTSTKLDLSKPPLALSGYVLTRLDHTYRNHTVELKPQGEGQMLLVLTAENDPLSQVHFLVDTTRHVVLSVEHRRNDKVTSSTKFDEFVEVAGGWWAGRIQSFDQQRRRTSVTTQEFKLFDTEAFGRRVEKQLAGRQQVQLLHEPLVKVVDAKGAFSTGKADFDDQLALILHFSESQQWDRVLEHLEQAEKLAGDKPGMRWVRDANLRNARRHEDLKQRILDRAGELAKPQAAGGVDSEELYLADYLRGQASGILQANEMLGLLDVLKPVYGRQAEHLHAMKRWMQQRVNYLRNTGQADEALRLQEQLAKEYPHDYSLQQQYAQALANAGQYEDAHAWLDRVITEEAKWRQYEEESLRNTYVRLLRNQGRYPDMAEYLAAWVKRNPEGSSAYSQYLSALIRVNQIDQANTLIAKWLGDARKPDRLPTDVSSRLQAAVSQALGQGYNMHTNRIDQRWLDPLADAALFFARHKYRASIADQIMRHGQFQRSDSCRRVRKRVLGILLAEIDVLSAEHVQRFVGWIMPNDPAVEKDVWKRIADALQKRWSAESDPDNKHQLAGPLVQILSSRLGAEEHLAFLRLQLKEGPEKHRASYVNQLFNALLSQPWSAAYEDEAFGLLERLSDAEEPAQRLWAQVAALYRLTDRMVQARYDARMAKVEHQEELTRIQLREKKEENLRLAREGFADRLAKAIREHPQAIGQWMNIERLYLETLLGRNLERVAEECWELLGPKPPEPLPPDAQPDLQQQLDAALRQRHLVTLANLAARKDAQPQLIDRLLNYVDQAIAAADPKDVGWKMSKHQLLVALDRPKDLVKDLQQWLRADDPASYWRLSLGYLLAEQGQIKPAITLFEAVEAEDELGPREYRTLADWYMVVDRREKHEEALIAVFMTMDEWRLRNWLSAKLNPWQRSDGQLPSELDKDVLRVFAALFRKSGSPQNYLSRLRGFYQATRDFRLLAGLADAVVGHTAAKVYPFLGGMGSVLSEVRDEATADSIIEHLAKVRQRAKTTVDHRALDLLEALVERRSSEVLNQPGPHVEKALAAMQRAFKREWSRGEPRLMADFLAGLGRITQSKLADEQIRELQVLHAGAAQGSLDRLHIGHRRANCSWSYDRHNEAIDLLQAALDEYQAACGGVLPTHANGPLESFVSYLEQRGHHARGEQVLFDQLEHPANQQQTYWLTRRLYQLYWHAIRNDGDVSLGSGATLYGAVHRQLQDELDTPDHNHRYNLINRLCDIYRAARDKKIAGYADDLRAFAFKRLPEVLKRQTNNYQSIVSQVAETLHNLASARDGLAFLIERIENEPQWFRFNRQDGWSRHASRLGRWRAEVKDLGDLEDRLLAIVTAELRRDLQSQQQRNRVMYYCQHSYYWKEKESDFRKTTEEVYAERKQSGAAVKYIAAYLYHGLHHYDRAIEILFVAHEQKILDENGQSTLVQYLHEQKRYGESIAILQPLVKLRPDNMQYRVWLMHAYFQTKRQAELLALLQQTDKYFHQKGRWTEAAMAPLAHSCLENHLYEQSAAYYEELIPLHQRTHPRRGIGNGTLSAYYRYMGQAYAGLNNTVKAVDAACGAIVSWGPTHKNRRQALENLRGVLRDAPDLDGYVTELDKQCAEDKQENPTVRKALGMVYAEKKQYDKAIVQLKLACEAEPNDAETHRQLVACYDEQQDKEGAVRQLLASLQLSRRDIQLYKDLARRLGELERPQEMERAHTSIVEALPSESESHAMLAEIRQGQDRWDEAIAHWRQVARIRALEPTGLLKLAAAQIHQRQWDAAMKTLRKLDIKGWPSRFGDVHDQVRDLERQIERERKD